MSLEDKSKTFVEMLSENASRCKDFMSKCQSCQKPCAKEKWVRLKDAQEEIQILKDYISDLTEDDIAYADRLDDCRKYFRQIRDQFDKFPVKTLGVLSSMDYSDSVRTIVSIFSWYMETKRIVEMITEEV